LKKKWVVRGSDPLSPSGRVKGDEKKRSSFEGIKGRKDLAGSGRKEKKDKPTLEGIDTSHGTGIKTVKDEREEDHHHPL